MKQRTSGILLHVTSLPGRFGCGDLGEGARQWIRFLAEAGQTEWQMLPIGPTGYGDSPYQSFSAFAGNPYFIDLEPLLQEGFLTAEETAVLDVPHIDYGLLYHHKLPLLRLAFRRQWAIQNEVLSERLAAYRAEQGKWLDDFARFMALKDRYGGAPHRSWGTDSPADEDVRFWCFTQMLFDAQWNALRRYAKERGVRLIGDLPIYVAADSADLWGNPELFELDERGEPTSVAGVPPDAFSDTGQLWGNPLYRWEEHRRTQYAWWIARAKRNFALFDRVRLDHFRGYESYWSVPATAENAVQGRWLPGPGAELFRAIEAAIPRDRLDWIAEDLGVITPAVDALREELGYPGMRVLQFGICPERDNIHLPHRYADAVIAYTGTHDNDTTRAWFDGLSARDRQYVRGYLGSTAEQKDAEIPLLAIRSIWASAASTAIAPLQDVLGLGAGARMNRPSTGQDNWKYRASAGDLTPELAATLYQITETFARLGGNQ
ncbi:MAG: 4-alpha-glucanotransferase [Bacillota bacterium]|nr:4-alpha-glucanotransferase [Bacillota bacterium]